MSERDNKPEVEPLETVVLSEAELEARNKRNRAIALGIVGFIALIFAITVFRLTSNIAAAGGA